MRNLKWIQIYPNVFCVHDGQEGVVYSPLQGKVFSVSQQGLGIIEDYLSHDMNPGHQFHSVLEERGFLEPIELPGVNESEIFDPSDLTLSLTSACNLRCIYCYADGGVSPKNLLWETIQASIDLLFHYAIRAGRKYLSISFHGGGEPTVLWKKLVRAVEYANGMLTNEQELSFSLVTNGTLITPEKAKWLASNSFALTVSFDGPEPVQNLQRPKVQGGGSYSDLVKGIKALVQAGVNFSLRATITGNNQHQLVEMVRLAHELGCSSLSVVPFSSTGRGENGIDGVDPQIFVTNYFLAAEEAERLNIDFSTVSDLLDTVSARYCNADGNNFAVMPDGISSCTRVTRSSDELSEMFFIGSWDEEGLQIDENKVRELRGLNLYSFSSCDECFARFSCSGGCHHDRFSSSPPSMPEGHCEIIRMILWEKLRKMLSN